MRDRFPGPPAKASFRQDAAYGDDSGPTIPGLVLLNS
ncbi:hypothetical protein SPLC1_S580230 [Arthrospira platensis C1]|nr:hypothetical protein SPLC1_S580230 [Arthrospira platensis C1]